MSSGWTTSPQGVVELMVAHGSPLRGNPVLLRSVPEFALDASPLTAQSWEDQRAPVQRPAGARRSSGDSRVDSRAAPDFRGHPLFTEPSNTLIDWSWI